MDIDIIAWQVENNTTAIWNILMEDSGFKELFKEQIKTATSSSDIVNTLSNYANENLI
tara:strand:+ start:126 stop:299 length:174 start_codon:yes stop_codon:yes gene_type:complete